MMRILIFVTWSAAVLFAGPAHADNRGAISDGLARVAAAAESYARSAGQSEDRAVRRKLAMKAKDIADDLTQLSRRVLKDVPLSAIAKEAVGIGRETAALVEAADEADDKAERRSLRAQATVIDQQLAAVRRQIDDAAAADSKPQQPAKPVAMSVDAFRAFLLAIHGGNFDKDKLQIVVQAAQTNWFTAGQIGLVMDLFDFGAGKVDAAAAMWPHMVDPENSFTIYGKLEFQGDKDKLRRKVTR
jgi:hypothetical protein